MALRAPLGEFGQLAFMPLAELRFSAIEIFAAPNRQGR
jgi:hypothetical protein